MRGVAGLGDRAPALCLARAVLAGHQAEGGFELMRVAKALRIVDGGEEGGGGDGADAGDGAQALHAGILDGEVFVVASEYVSCPLRGRMRAYRGATTERTRPGRGKPCTRGTTCSALPEGTRELC